MTLMIIIIFNHFNISNNNKNKNDNIFWGRDPKQNTCFTL